MAPSQLKRLKESLRQNGITGPPKSKKEKKKGVKPEQRVQRNVALANIRESFNPFEIKQPSRPSKMDVTTAKTMTGKAAKQAVARPGVTKSLGEQARRETLLLEMQKRNKVGGILDRRIGENDPTMTPEERALERFTREKGKKHKSSLFDLEMDEPEEQLTHMGRTLTLDERDMLVDDFDAGNLSSNSEEERDGIRPPKRRHAQLEELPGAQSEEPERKKTKAEVMKEVIAKSKLHKYERQAAKEEDEDVREELDKGIGDLRAVLGGLQNSLAKLPKPAAAESAFAAKPKEADPFGDYDKEIRKMALDRRSKPADRTKTDEEKIQEEAERLKELEEKRLRRMKGEAEESDEEESEASESVGNESDQEEEEEEEADDAVEFGLPSNTRVLERPAGFEDEDEFLVDVEMASSDEEDNESVGNSDSDSDSDSHASNDGGDDLREEDLEGSTLGLKSIQTCPRTYEDLLAAIEGVAWEHVTEAIRRIRVLHDLSLSADNRGKLADFSESLVQFLVERPNVKPALPLKAYEGVIRHIHSMARQFVDQIGQRFRTHLREMHSREDMTAGDLMVLTAIGAIFPTSDHFHQVVTPAITIMCRWLERTKPTEIEHLRTGAYIGALCIKYQGFSKRYIPELVRFTLQAMQTKHHPLPELEPHVANLIAMADLWSDKSAFTEIFSAAPAILESLKQRKAQQHIQILLDQAQLARRPLELHHHLPLPIKTAIPKFEENFNPDKHYDPDRERADAAKLRAEYKRERKGAMRELRKDSNFVAREKLKEKKEKDRAYEEKYRKLVSEIQGEEGREKNIYEREKRMRKSKH
ncbi:Nop14-like protein [Trichodelitschia bisporula]|uniref:Nop14-like protein n=1 Tax=Trichodelitschia bisporula TaxID=703511 RepID=A0A6G1I6C9_9PEZI|nr:Nop14-like protein [Trichodelitschia bisporula]